MGEHSTPDSRATTYAILAPPLLPKKSPYHTSGLDLMISDGGVALYAGFAARSGPFGPSSPKITRLVKREKKPLKQNEKAYWHPQAPFLHSLTGSQGDPHFKKSPMCFQAFWNRVYRWCLILDAWYNSLNIITLFCFNFKVLVLIYTGQRNFPSRHHKRFDRAFELMACLIDA